jgi:hypothetical protein
MTLSPIADHEWELLGSHQGLVQSLVWSSDGATLFSGSGDGEIRGWTDHQYVTIRPGGRGFIYAMDWCSQEDQLIVAVDNNLEIYRHNLVRTIDITAQAIRCNSNGTYAALREWLSGKKNEPPRPSFSDTFDASARSTAVG